MSIESREWTANEISQSIYKKSFPANESDPCFHQLVLLLRTHNPFTTKENTLEKQLSKDCQAIFRQWMRSLHHTETVLIRSKP